MKYNETWARRTIKEYNSYLDKELNLEFIEDKEMLPHAKGYLATKNQFGLKNQVQSGHIQYKFKCLYCGLEFGIYSWFLDWVEKVGRATCPECKRQMTFLLAILNSNEKIFESSYNHDLDGMRINE